MDALHVVRFGHGAVDHDPDRHRVAVVGELRQRQRDFPLLHRRALADLRRERIERLLLRDRGEREAPGEAGEEGAAPHFVPFTLAGYATTSSTCCAERTGLPRYAGATCVRPSMR